MKPKLLIVGDFVKHTGFARVNEAIAHHLRDRWDIAVLAINYKGDYTPLQHRYRLYPAHLGGDQCGVGRIADIIRVEQPDAILVVNDPWMAGEYIPELLGSRPPMVLYTPVDAASLRPVDVELLCGYTAVVAYTQFGRQQLEQAGLTMPIEIIPHGIDLETFYPVPQADARRLVGMPQDTFAVLVLDRNQPRKRLDIAFEAFAMFAEGKPANVRLVYHGALKDAGWDIEDMARDLGIDKRLILTGRGFQSLAGVPIDQLRTMYSMCDVRLSTTSGEGWGLPTMEAMACGLPNILPQFAALGEWANGAAYMVEAPIRTRHAQINTVGQVPHTEDVAYALNTLYMQPEQRQRLRAAGLDLVQEDQYRWSTIADQFHEVLAQAVQWRRQAEGRAA